MTTTVRRRVIAPLTCLLLALGLAMFVNVQVARADTIQLHVQHNVNDVTINTTCVNGGASEGVVMTLCIRASYDNETGLQNNGQYGSLTSTYLNAYMSCKFLGAYLPCDGAYAYIHFRRTDVNPDYSGSTIIDACGTYTGDMGPKSCDPDSNNRYGGFAIGSYSGGTHSTGTWTCAIQGYDQMTYGRIDDGGATFALNGVPIQTRQYKICDDY